MLAFYKNPLKSSLGLSTIMRFVILFLIIILEVFALNERAFKDLISNNIEDKACMEFLIKGNRTAINTNIIVTIGGIDDMTRQEKLDLALCIININQIKTDFENNENLSIKCEEKTTPSSDDIAKGGAFVGYDLSYLKPEIIILKNPSTSVRKVLNHEVLHCLNYFSYRDLSLLEAINGRPSAKKSCLLEKQKFEHKLYSLLKNKIRLSNALTDDMLENKIGEFGFNKGKDMLLKNANRQVKQSFVKVAVQNFLDVMQAYKKTASNALCGEFVATASQSFPVSVINYLSKSTAKFIEKHINEARLGAYQNLSDESKFLYSKIVSEN